MSILLLVSRSHILSSKNLGAFSQKDGFPGDSYGKESACNTGDHVQSLCLEDPLEKGMSTHYSILA